METLYLTPGTHISDLLQTYPEAESVLGWYGDEVAPEERRTLSQFAHACGMDVRELLIDLRASLALHDSTEGEDGNWDGNWDESFSGDYESNVFTIDALR